VIEHWWNAGAWMRSPVLVSGEVIGASLDSQSVAGFTRPGNLLGLLDREEIPDAGPQRMWLGRRMPSPG
jgi:hypothetical protein